MEQKNTVGLDELLKIFEEDVTLAYIDAAKYLGKISAAIVNRRMELQMTQKEFAQYINVSQGMVSKWEGGNYNFTIKGLAEIADKLEMELYINLKKYRTNFDISYVEDNKYACLSSGKRNFVEISNKVVSFPIKTKNVCTSYVKKLEKNQELVEM